MPSPLVPAQIVAATSMSCVVTPMRVTADVVLSCMVIVHQVGVKLGSWTGTPAVTERAAQGNASGRSSDVSSQLLASLMAAAASSDVRETSEQLLSQLHVEPARSNDYVELFADR